MSEDKIERPWNRWGKPMTDEEWREEKKRQEREKRTNEVMSSSKPLYVLLILAIGLIYALSKTGCHCSNEELIR